MCCAAMATAEASSPVSRCAEDLQTSVPPSSRQCLQEAEGVGSESAFENLGKSCMEGISALLGEPGLCDHVQSSQKLDARFYKRRRKHLLTPSPETTKHVPRRHEAKPKQMY